MRVRYLDAAKRDLDDIFAFAFEASRDERTAEIAVRRLFEQCERLAELSGTMGRPRPELAAGLRSFPFRGYLIFFRYESDEMIVVNVLNGRRDLSALFDVD